MILNNKKRGKDGRELSEEDCAVMLRLTVTDYALWADAELRRTFEFAEEECTSALPCCAMTDS